MIWEQITVQVKEMMCITYLLLFLKEYFTEKCEFCYYLVTLVSFKGTVHPKIMSFPTCLQTLNTKESVNAMITKYFRLPLTSVIFLATQWKSNQNSFIFIPVLDWKHQRWINDDKFHLWMDYSFKTCMLPFFSDKHKCSCNSFTCMFIVQKNHKASIWLVHYIPSSNIFLDIHSGLEWYEGELIIT